MRKLIFLLPLTLLAQPPQPGRDPRWQTIGSGPVASRPNCPAPAVPVRSVWICLGTGCSTTAVIHYCTAAGWAVQTGSSGGGTVTSVGLAGTANQISVSGATPITGSGAWTLSIPSIFTLPGTVNKITLTAPTTAWTITPAADNQATTIPAGTLLANSRSVATSSPLSGGGALSADLTLSCPTCTTNAAALTANNLVMGGGGQAAVDSGLSLAVANTHSATLRVDGGSSTFSTGPIGSAYETEFPGTIYKVVTTGSAAASGAAQTACTATVDVWKHAAAVPVSSGDKISASAPAALSAATQSEDSTLTGWSKTVTADDYFTASVASNSTCLSATVQIWWK